MNVITELGNKVGKTIAVARWGGEEMKYKALSLTRTNPRETFEGTCQFVNTISHT
jgi:hypothetical protein